MAEEADSAQGRAPRMNTNITFEAPKKTLAQEIVVWTVRLAVTLTMLAAGAYVFFNLTPAGEELKHKYEKRCRETDELLDDGIEFCRFYISYFGRPPTSAEDVQKFQVERLMHPFTQYHAEGGGILTYWNGKDGFGHEVKIQVNPQTRTIKLTSPGALPLTGNKPAIFDYVREASY